MIQGSLPAASIHGTWLECLEVVNMDDDQPVDLSGVVEITLWLRDQYLEFNSLTLTMSNGDITIPSPGIIQWRAERGLMGTLEPKLYEAVMVIKDGVTGDELPLIMGPISIVG